MKLKAILSLVAFLLILSPLAFSQSRETGAIVGKVTDEENNPLPGVTVTATSPNLMGTRTFVTDAQGEYRFPALPPGDYALKAELQGFATTVQENIRLTTTVRLTVDLTMKPATVAEEVTVVAQSPTVDVKSTETASITLSNEILRNVPYSQYNFTSDIVNMAPGVTPSSQADVAYGAQDGTGIAYSMDGVNVADPEGGTAWVFVDLNIIEEAKIMGIGLPAEYGNFTGVIFNMITKSGGNEFSGHFELDVMRKKEDRPKGLWQAENNQNYINDFPDLTSPRERNIDANAHLGGPIKKDKIWFFAGLQYNRRWNYPAGFPLSCDYKQPRSFLKITSQLTPKLNMSASVEVDDYDRTHRDGWADRMPEATVKQSSPEVVGNFNLTQILSPKTFFDLKVAFFWGYYYLDPTAGTDVNAHYIMNSDYLPAGLKGNMMYYNSPYQYLADRSRLQANASLTHYTENFIQGSHDFKFGVEIEHSWNRSRSTYTGTNHTYYVDYWYPSWNYPGFYYAGNYLKYQWDGYDYNVKYTRLEGFAQDSWQITRNLNINVGVRLSQNWGTVKGLEGTPWKSFRIAPRIGFVYDLFGDKSTVFKAHYGQFTEAMFAAYFYRLSPKQYDYVEYSWNPESQEWIEYARTVQNWSLQEGIKHPYMDQFTIGIERELFKDASLSVSFIYRNWKNQIGVYDTLARYEKVNYEIPELNKSFELWNLTSGDAHKFVIENIKQGPDRPYYMGNPYRKYTGLEFLFNKRFSNRWQLVASYVYSKTKGTIDNEWGNDIGMNTRSGLITGDPNYWINADGYSTYDPTHMIKVGGTYVLPYEINFTASFGAISGERWTQRLKTSSSLLNQGSVTFFTESRGTNHYPMQKNLDLRLEKTFTLATKYRLSLFLDVFNVFNADTIIDWGTRIGTDWLLPGDPDYYQSTDGHELLGIVRPRQARIGIRLIF